jgi:hypothetical protein
MNEVASSTLYRRRTGSSSNTGSEDFTCHTLKNDHLDHKAAVAASTPPPTPPPPDGFIQLCSEIIVRKANDGFKCNLKKLRLDAEATSLSVVTGQSFLGNQFYR